MNTFKKLNALILTFSLVSVPITVSSAERDQAKKLYSSLTGNTANKAQADYYEQLIKEGSLAQAALEMVESNKGFYNVTLKNFFTPMSNEDGSSFAPLNDMTATLIGATRDNLDFFRVFYDDVLYQFDGELINNEIQDLPEAFARYQPTNDWFYLRDLGVAVPMYNRTKNDMYLKAEEGNVPLGNRKYFKLSSQKTFTTKQPEAIAGIFSTRAWAEAFYQAGTNRAAFAFFAKNFMCLEMEQLSDTTIPDYRIRRDVDRAPGGFSETFKNSCVGCHAGMDALAGAFSYYDFVDGTMVYFSHDTDEGVLGPVAPKINLNNLFSEGHITQSDSWVNLWTSGQNEYIGWGEASAGSGVVELGRMLSETQQVRTCLSQKVFETVCYRKPESLADQSVVQTLAAKFDRDGNMKDLFINSSIACMGE